MNKKTYLIISLVGLTIFGLAFLSTAYAVAPTRSFSSVEEYPKNGLTCSHNIKSYWNMTPEEWVMLETDNCKDDTGKKILLVGFYTTFNGEITQEGHTRFNGEETDTYYYFHASYGPLDENGNKSFTMNYDTTGPKSGPRAPTNWLSHVAKTTYNVTTEKVVIDLN